jgi:hypothetical protein
MQRRSNDCDSIALFSEFSGDFNLGLAFGLHHQHHVHHVEEDRDATEEEKDRVGVFIIQFDHDRSENDANRGSQPIGHGGKRHNLGRNDLGDVQPNDRPKGSPVDDVVENQQDEDDNT